MTAMEQALKKKERALQLLQEANDEIHRIMRLTAIAMEQGGLIINHCDDPIRANIINQTRIEHATIVIDPPDPQQINTPGE